MPFVVKLVFRGTPVLDDVEELVRARLGELGRKQRLAGCDVIVDQGGEGPDGADAVRARVVVQTLARRYASPDFDAAPVCGDAREAVDAAFAAVEAEMDAAREHALRRQDYPTTRIPPIRRSV